MAKSRNSNVVKEGMKMIPYKDGVRNADGTWDICPVHNILGFHVRCDFFQTHHGYYPFGLWPLGIWLLTFDSYPAILFGEVLIFIGMYLFYDDWFDQHHEQVHKFKPLYHSPAHNFFSEYLWQFWLVRKITQFADWLFGLFK